MTRLLSIVARAIIYPDRAIEKVIGTASPRQEEQVDRNNEKFFIDRNGSVILNRNNIDVQKAFANNVSGLSSQKNKG